MPSGRLVVAVGCVAGWTLAGDGAAGGVACAIAEIAQRHAVQERKVLLVTL
jgi:hypothetical protein